MSGLTATGLELKTQEEILAEIEASQRGDIDANLDTSAESVVGQLNAVIAPKLRELWELLGIVYDARRPGGATGATLEALCEITGTERAIATKGRVELTLTVAASATVPAGSVAHVTGQPDNRWITTEDAVNTDILPASVTVSAEAAAAGRYVANAGQIAVIATPVSGWTAVTNAADASAGSEAESEPALRLRREQELSRPGSTTVEAIRADLLAMEYDNGERVLVGCLVEENSSAYRDSLRRPPKSVEAVVEFPSGLSGDELAAARQRVADQLWASKPGGIELYGSETGEVVDSLGETRAVAWSEPDLVDVYVTVSIEVDAAAFAGAASVQDAAVAFGDALVMGADVVRSKLSAALVAVAGVTDAVSLSIGRTSTALREGNLSVGRRERASFDTSRVTVTVL